MVSEGGITDAATVLGCSGVRTGTVPEVGYTRATARPGSREAERAPRCRPAEPDPGNAGAGRDPNLYRRIPVDRKEDAQLNAFRDTRVLTEAALAVALSFVLGFVVLFKMPYGGAVSWR